jgi:hypothetical protein
MWKWLEIEAPPQDRRRKPPDGPKRGVSIVQCCNDPQVRGGKCENCGTWIDNDQTDLPQGDNEG